MCNNGKSAIHLSFELKMCKRRGIDVSICWHGKLLFALRCCVVQYAFVLYSFGRTDDEASRIAEIRKIQFIISNWFFNNISSIIGNVENRFGERNRKCLLANHFHWCCVVYGVCVRENCICRLSVLSPLANDVCFVFRSQKFSIAHRDSRRSQHIKCSCIYFG